MRFTKKQMDNWKEIFEREGKFQWDITGGYIIFADEFMDIFQFRNGKWFHKKIFLWRFKTVTQVNQELAALRWADAG